MPIYKYVCETCGFEGEENHSVKEIDKGEDSEYLKCRLSNDRYLQTTKYNEFVSLNSGGCKLRRVIGKTSFIFK